MSGRVGFGVARLAGIGKGRARSRLGHNQHIQVAERLDVKRVGNQRLEVEMKSVA
jgi:hypothetical protein